MKVKLFNKNFSEPKYELNYEKMDVNYIVKDNELYSFYSKEEDSVHFVAVPFLDLNNK